MKRMMAVMAIVMVLTLALSAGTASAWGPGPGNVYVVQRGDTLSSIAFNLGVSMYELGRINGIMNPNLIWAGQCLTIPARNYGGWGQPTNWGGNNCGQSCWNQGWNQCGNECGWNQCGNQCGWNQGGYGQPTGYWGNYGYNGGCSTCNQGVPIPYGFQQNSVTLESNYSTTFERG